MEETAISKPIAGVIALCLAVGIFGCANPGIPKPPSLRLPATVLDLTGRRVGDRVELHWTGPGSTSDGLDLTGPTTVEICRDPAPAQSVSPANASPVVPCTTILSTTGHPGDSTAVTQLPASLIAATGRQPLVAYRIRILNSSGRSASPSVPVFIPGGPAPAMVPGFRAEQQKAGVVLAWYKVPEESAPVEVLRTIQTAQAGAPVDHTTKPPTPGKGSKSNGPDPFARARREKNTVSISLRQGSEAPMLSQPPYQANRSEGMIDQSALQQETYTYTAERVLTVPFAGKLLEIRSEPTPPITIAMRDTFAPMPPRGLISVPGVIGLATAETSSHRTIDLAWEPNAETDLTGYMVYRADVEAGKPAAAKPIRLTPEPLAGPAYRDTAVLAGHRYRYQVTAIDRNGNESALSAPIEDAPNGR